MPACARRECRRADADRRLAASLAVDPKLCWLAAPPSSRMTGLTHDRDIGRRDHNVRLPVFGRIAQIAVIAERCNQFWNTGDESLLKAVISPNFTDHTLPPGRPQGPQGPAFASKHFRAAAPDLTVEIRKLVVADDYVHRDRPAEDRQRPRHRQLAH